MEEHDAARLRSRLEDAVHGEVHAAPYYRAYYSVDASSYIIRPDIVVVPRDAGDIVRTIGIAVEAGAAITSRGGGTGLVGGALNSGIILDMKRMSSVRITGRTVAAEAGATRGRLDLVLQSTGMMFAPNPSVGPFCTIGGMVASNAAGSRSLKYGCTIDNVTAITMIDGTGRRIRLPDDEETGSRILDIAGRIDGGRFPRVSKNSSGYRLDAVASMRDTHKALIGSEGTLGVIVSAELKTVRRPEKRRLYILEYGSETEAAVDSARIVNATSPVAAEFVDRVVLGNMDCEFGKSTSCLLLVEYYEGADGSGGKARGDTSCDNGRHCHHDGAGVERTESTAGTLRSITSAASNAARSTCVTDEAEITRWWEYRDASLHYSLRDIDPDTEERVPHIIEDATVPPATLPALFAALRAIDDKYGTRTITYGHAGNGNIHTRLVCKKGGTRHLRRIAAEYLGKIMAAGGSTTGEHGDGLARSEFVTMQYGPKNTARFAELKNLFDPSNIMNPGKILTNKTGILDQNLWNFLPPKT